MFNAVKEGAITWIIGGAVAVVWIAAALLGLYMAALAFIYGRDLVWWVVKKFKA